MSLYDWAPPGATKPPRVTVRVLTRNAARCLKCGNLIESKHRHDFQTCNCGAISVDGGLDYLKRGGVLKYIKEESQYQERPVDNMPQERGKP